MSGGPLGTEDRKVERNEQMYLCSVHTSHTSLTSLTFFIFHFILPRSGAVLLAISGQIQVNAERQLCIVYVFIITPSLLIFSVSTRAALVLACNLLISFISLKLPRGGGAGLLGSGKSGSLGAGKKHRVPPCSALQSLGGRITVPRRHPSRDQ